ncbi:MAG: MFS transporter [Terrimesophilobacter sp.]
MKPSRRATAPLYAAGFTTAFGAHSIAAGLGAETTNMGVSLLTFGLLLAVYDIAEVILKPIFGYVSDVVGVKPVIVIGLAVFAATSLLGALGASPILLGIARLGQGASAAAFSPASSSAVARLAGSSAAGRYFGRYGSWKGIGYALGPLLGAALIFVGGFPALFATLSIIAAATSVWALIALPRIPVLSRPRYTFIDLISQSTDRSFLIPTLALAAASGALGVAVGFIPLLGTALHLSLFASMAAVTILAVSSAAIQPLIGRLRDGGHISSRAGMATGLALITVGIVLLAIVPLPATLYLAAVILGFGIGITTPLGFAHLATTTPPERMGRTMGNAELGREVGDAGGPLMVGGIATAFGLMTGLGALALVVGGAAIVCGSGLQNR